MLQTEKVKLLATSGEKAILLSTMETFNAACDKISSIAFQCGSFNFYALHKLAYYGIREEFHLPAQLTIRAIAKVAESYRQEKSRLHLFQKRGCVVYDNRILNLKGETVSLTTISGRVEVLIRSKPNGLLGKGVIRNQMDLVYVDGDFYLNLVFETQDSPEITPTSYLGVDMGIKNLASTSDGVIFSGQDCRKNRDKYKRLRGKLQRVGTKSAKKHLKKIGRKESRFKRHMNHIISKAIVCAAEGTTRGIAIEDLNGIRSQETVGKRRREERDHWAFDKLKNFIEYKAKMKGIPVIVVDAHDTSMICSRCGCCEPHNRNKSSFHCSRCGYCQDADINAAKNIASRAAIARPIVVHPEEKGVWNDKPLPFQIDAGYSHSTVAGGLLVMS